MKRIIISSFSGLAILGLLIWALACQSGSHSTSQTGSEVSAGAHGSTQDIVLANTSPSTEELKELAKEHLVVNSVPNGMQIQQIKFDHTQGEDRLSESQFGIPIRKAAELYAMVSGDYDVTLAEIKSAGFWPFQIPLELKDDTHVPSVGRVDSLDYEFYLGLIGTDEYYLQAKYQILQTYYHFYYSDSFASDSPMLPAELLREKSIEFWINPLSGKPMRESPDIGDYRIIDQYVSCSCLLGETLKLPLINLAKIEDSGLEGTDRNTNQQTLMCCVFQVHSDGNINPFSRYSGSECFDACVGYPPCCVEFEITGGYAYSYYTLARKVPCDNPGALGSGEILRSPGQSAPASHYGGGAVSITKDDCFICHSALAPAGPEYNDYINFLTGLTAPGQGFVTSRPGPVCH